MTTKEKVRDLIADGKTEDVLILLSESSEDAKMLQARFMSGKKQYQSDLIQFAEWQRIQAGVNYSLLEIVNKIKEAPLQGNVSEIDALKAENERLRTFIEDIANPRRGSAAENWTIQDAADVAQKLLKQ